jgi:hypothetical protein
MLRQWSAADLALLVLAILPGAAMLAGTTESATTRKQNSTELQRLSALVSSQLGKGT